MEKPIRVYQCEDSIDGILSAVYEAGISGYGHDYIKIEPQRKGEAANIILFSEYVTVTTDEKKRDSVIDAVRSKISYEAYIYVMHAASSNFMDRGDAIYQFVTYGFSMGQKVCGAVQIPCVKRIFEISRAYGNEAHYYLEFLRFQEISKEPSLLLAVIEPRHQIIPMVTDHFADRFPSEWFIIYDKTHREASFHNADGNWEVRILSKDEADKLEELTEEQEEYVDLWKTFFENIAIVERKNKNLQRNMLPLHYRKHMTEFIS